MRARLGAWRVSLTLFRSMLVLATECVLLVQYRYRCLMLVISYVTAPVGRVLYLSYYIDMFVCLKVVMCLISARLSGVDW